MASKTTTIKIRETRENVFNVLKQTAPGIFGTKVFSDVSFFGQDPADTSKFLIEFLEE